MPTLTGEYRLGVELDALDGVLAMAHTHDDPVVGLGRDLERGGQGSPLDDQRVVAGGLERIDEPTEHSLPAVADPRGLAVHQTGSPDHLAAEDLPDALVAQTDPEERAPGPEGSDDRLADTGVVGSPRAGRDHYSIGIEPLDTLQIDRVMPMNNRRRTEPPEHLHEVVGEGVVVVDDQHGRTHGGPTVPGMTRPRPGSLASRLAGAPTRTVLVVEDEPDIAGFLGAFFRASGTEVVHVDPTTTAEVVEEAVRLDAACALVDLNLTGITGFDVIEALQADERVAGIPVIIVTADSRPATQQRAAALGAVGFVPKPFNIKDLFTTVEAILDGRAGDDAPETDPTDPERATGTQLISAEAVHARLAAAVATGRRTNVSTTFALIRLAGTSASPAIMGEVARALGPALPTGELLGATAADELAVLFATDGPEAAGAALAAALGDGRLDLHMGSDRVVTVDLRAGIAGSPDHATTGEELYMAADIALSDARSAGRATLTAR